MTIDTITLAFSGASGVPYGLRLLEILLQQHKTIYCVISHAAREVFRLECGIELPKERSELENYLLTHYGTADSQLTVFDQRDWCAPIASGSGVADAMVVCPCSSSGVAKIAAGYSETLLERAADVTIKEKKPLILVHRETPLSEIHLQNLLQLSRIGVTIMPASPGFYHQPQTVSALVDFIVARVLDHLHIAHQLIPRWGQP